MSNRSSRKFPIEEVQAIASALSSTDAYRVLGNLLVDVFGVVDADGAHWIDFDREPDEIDAKTLVAALRQEFLPRG